MTHRVIQKDALMFLKELPDDSVGLILTDPPYFKVKPQDWDRQWSEATGFLDWLDEIAEQWARVLKPTGTLVCFAGANPAVSPGASLAALVEVKLAERFNVIGSCVWIKSDKHGRGRHNQISPPSLRSYFPQTERAIICEHYGEISGEDEYHRKLDDLRGVVFEPLRLYLNSERERAGITKRDVDEAWRTKHGNNGGMSSHWFSMSQWRLPTLEHYLWLREVFGEGFLLRDHGDLRHEHNVLQREYDERRLEFEHLRRKFDATVGQHHTDVWTYFSTPPHKFRHPCEKPSEMAVDLVKQCSKPGDVVLDTFAGSGSFLAAAAREGRIAWGCDFSPQWSEVAWQAVVKACKFNYDKMETTPHPKTEVSPQEEVDLFDFLQG